MVRSWLISPRQLRRHCADLLIVLGEPLNEQAQLLPGTLDVLILKAVSLGPLHGYEILLRIGQISGRALLIGQGGALSRIIPPSASGPSERKLGHLGE